MFHWTPDMLSFMADASRNTDYYRQLVLRIAAIIPDTSHVCDAGCGMGYLSLALARKFYHVTAIDIAPQAVTVLKQNMKAAGIVNLTALCGDITAMTAAVPYDAMVFCLFGKLEQILRIAAKQCSGKLIIIAKDCETHRFSLTHPPLEYANFSGFCRILEKRHIPYTSERACFELGQPLRSLSDAVRFFQTYSKDADPSCVCAENIEKLLVRTDNPDFPYYLPEQKRMGILTVETDAIRSTAASQD
jgi:SAM-dependent methyltransferase